MKLLSDTSERVMICKTCGAVFQYEDEDYKYEKDEWRYGGMGRMMRDSVHYIECPICNKRYEFYQIPEWKEEK